MRNFVLASLFSVIILFPACSGDSAKELKSPDGKISVQLLNDETGILKYTVKKEGKTIIEPSALGFIRNDADYSHLKIVDSGEMRTVSGSYATPAGKKQVNYFHANEWDIKTKNPDGKILTISFYISDKGIAFRYTTDEATKNEKTILKENTSFKLPVTAKGWLHPHDDVKNCWAQTCPSYEDNYITDIAVGTPAPKKAGWSFPALFNSDDTWILITEAGLEPPYCGTRLAQESPQGEYFIEFPQKGESMNPEDTVNPVSNLPFRSPWRVIMLGELGDIIENTLVTEVSEPNRIEDMGFIKPGIASWSWGAEGDSSTKYDRQKQYIDYAAEMGWEFTLIDAFWDMNIGYDKIKELIDYAKSKNVDILLWYNSAGDWNTTPQTPKDILIDQDSRRSEFEKLQQMGVAGLKIDFFPGDGPSVIQYYYDIMQDAADYKLMLNFHGTTVPRGWSRTFPHMMTFEAIKGFEFITFGQETANLAPEHCATAVFARNVVGPMDFTPVYFGEIRRIDRKTSNGFEIALSVLFQSGIQHIVTTPEIMAQQQDYVQEYMKNIPRTWDDIKFIDGFPAKYAVIARKSGDKWYIGGINAEASMKTLELDLSALEINTTGYIISDGNSNREFSYNEIIPEKGKINIDIQPNGGFVMVF